jgi:hypothetical protein
LELPKPQVEVQDVHGRWLGVANTLAPCLQTPLPTENGPGAGEPAPFTRSITPQACTQAPTACTACDSEACWDSVATPQAPFRGTASRTRCVQNPRTRPDCKPGQAAWFADESPFAVVSAWHLQAGSCAVDHLSNSITFPSPPVLPVPHLLPGSPVGDLCLQARPAVAGVPRLQGWRRCRGPVVRGGENVQAVDREHPANGTWCVPSR